MRRRAPADTVLEERSRPGWVGEYGKGGQGCVHRWRLEDESEVGNGAAPAVFPEGNAGGNDIASRGTPGVRHAAQADPSVDSVGPLDRELENAVEDPIFQTTASWLDVLQSHHARGDLGDVPFHHRLQMIGSCDGVEPRRHVLQLP